MDGTFRKKPEARSGARAPRIRSTRDYTILVSIASTAREHDLDPNQLIDAFCKACQSKIAQCGRLEVSQRNGTHDSATFLITEDGEVIWQARVNLYLVRNPHIRDSIARIARHRKEIGLNH